MSIQIANIDLSGAVVGTAGKITIPSMPPTPIAAQMAPQRWSGATLLVYNESGCGLTVTFPISNETITIAAGHWKQLHVPPDEVELDYIVIYVLPNAPVSLLLADLYLATEAVDSVGSLGNSPIGLGTTFAQSNQQRVITLPIAPISLVTRNQAPPAPGSDTILRIDGLGATPPGGSKTPTINMYLYYCCVRLSTPSTNYTLWDATLFCDIMSTTTVEASIVMHNILVYSSFAAANTPYLAPHDFMPATATMQSQSFNFGGLPPPLTAVRWRLHTNGIVGGPPAAWWDIGVGVDIVNTVGPGTHGNFTINTGIF